MKRLSIERKQQVLARLLPPNNERVADVAKEEGIAMQTLYNWKNKAKQEGIPVPGSVRSSDQWTPESKLAVIIETASLSQAELSQYCREKGLYPEQIQRWKSECLQGFATNRENEKQIKQQSKNDQKEIKSLKKELRRKEKALAETAALLTLRKKFNALYAVDEDD